MNFLAQNTIQGQKRMQTLNAEGGGGCFGQRGLRGALERLHEDAVSFRQACGPCNGSSPLSCAAHPSRSVPPRPPPLQYRGCIIKATSLPSGWQSHIFWHALVLSVPPRTGSIYLLHSYPLMSMHTHGSHFSLPPVVCPKDNRPPPCPAN
jgi:hypothetical protein